MRGSTHKYKMKRISCLLLILFVSVSSYGQNRLRTDLGGGSWKLREVSGTVYYNATVPGCVHTDLINNGAIDDPYYRDNETRVQWIGEKNWEYSLVFNAGDDIHDRENIELVFEGLDTYANVYLNGKIILYADNFFRQWRTDLKEYLKPEENMLTVTFLSSPEINGQTRADAEIPLLEDYVYTRKPAYHYGWDWGPVLVTQGIWRPVYLESWNGARIKNVHIRSLDISDDNAELSAITDITASREGEYILSLKENGKTVVEEKTLLKKGDNTVTLGFNIRNPKLWWTHQLGEPHLYNFTMELSDGDAITDSTAVRTGLRTIELVQEPDSLGKTFYFRLNGVPVFMKGANYIPQDMFLNRVTEADYRGVIEQAKEANMNMLRVWGGGIYENDIFYDLCDENGILVWQDFMFACALYPGDPGFMENVEAEIHDNVIRLRNHPSIALWCGNNENYIGWLDWGWQKKFTKEERVQVWNDYEELFEKLIPSTLSKLLPDNIYWPSSPKKNWGRPSNTDGDSHYWGVWHGQYPFEVLSEPENIPRFMSEFGFQSCPGINSVKRFTEEGDRNINSPVMRLHQKHRIGYPVIDKYMAWYYRAPKDFESYLYVSQVLQAKGVRYGIEVHRRSMPHCMGTLYWQLNDCYPVASWSGVDYYDDRKALHYAVKKAYSDILVSPFEENGAMNIYVVSDEQTARNATLNLTLTDLSGKNIYKKKIKTIINPNRSEIHFSIPTDELLKGRDRKNTVLLCELRDGKNTLSENIYYFSEPKDLQLEKSDITTGVKRTEKGYELTLTAKKLAKNVYIDIDGENILFSDNYFDLLPGRSKKISVLTNSEIENIGSRIKIFSLIDSYL